MPLRVGERLGPYEILSPIGAGGMGQVFKPRDTRLDRTVAVKVLPDHLSSSPEARQRFEREARTISQLSHPHICALHDVGNQDGVEYLVMEYLEGETLADRLGRGALPLDQTLRYGVEIADALDKAHRQGVIHRDLKPGNVMLTNAGVKLLDFGLAKAVAPAGPAAPLTSLPTMAAGRSLTQEGVLLGTFQYMAPEQLEAKPVDARTDIFTLGACLYEMATGNKAFPGATQASLISSIMTAEPPPISSLQPMTPAGLDRIVRTCLAKDPEGRWQTARDVGLQLDWIRREQSAPQSLPARPAPRKQSATVAWSVAAAAVAVAILALAAGLRPKPRPRVMRSFLVPPRNTAYHFFGANVAPPAISPDGRRLVFGVREADGSYRLWVRDLDALEGYPLAGSDGGLFPFWSPDSRSIGFFAKGRLKVVEASPSPPPAREIAEVVEARGGTWGADGTIVYSPTNFTSLMRVSANGGASVPATRLDIAAGELAHRWPRFLSDGRRFLYEVRRGAADPTAASVPVATYVASIDGKEKRLVLSEGSGVTYASPGYLLFRRASSLMAVACDPRSLALRGDPVVLADDLEGFAATGMSLFAVREDLLLYSPSSGMTPSRVVWIDRSGKEVGAVGSPGRFTHVALSSDGRTAVVAQIEEPLPPDLWALDTGIGRGIRLTRDTLAQVVPVFSSDGRIFFSSNPVGAWDIFQITPQGTDLKPFLESPSSKIPNDVSPDRQWLLYREINPATRGDLKALPLKGDRTPRTFLATPSDEGNGDFSPDSRWVAYVSDESGRKEVYVASFADPTRRFRVSSDGGLQPRWSRDGKELFYVRSGKLLAAAVSGQGEALTFGEGRVLFELPLFMAVDPGFNDSTRYDVAPDGRFLALIRTGNERPTPLVLVQNWRETLRK